MITSALTAIAALLASATFIWTAGIIIIIAMAILLENELEGWATTCFSLGIALILWNFKGGIWEYVSSNPSATIGFAVTYLIAGIVWSFLKWRSYVVNVFTKIKEVKAKFEADHGEINAKNIDKLNDRLRSAGLKGYYEGILSMGDNGVKDLIKKYTPQASQKKSVITSWISYWPVSLTGTLLNNPFRQFFEWIYSLLSSSYDRMTAHYQDDILGK